MFTNFMFINIYLVVYRIATLGIMDRETLGMQRADVSVFILDVGRALG